MRFASFSLRALAAQASASANAALSPCALNCLIDAADATECKVPANFTCACTNADFQFKAQSCLTNECQAAEVGAALDLQQSQCGAASLSATVGPTATIAFLPFNPAADISRSPAASASASAALSPCALNCILDAADATECKVPGNVTCTCTNADFQFKAQSCLTNECQAAEVGAALDLQQSQCGADSLSVTVAPTATVVFLPFNPAADISSSSSASITSGPIGTRSASKTIGSSSSQTGNNERQPASGKHDNTGVIAGVVGGAVAIMFGLLMYWFVRRRHKSGAARRPDTAPFWAALEEHEATRGSFTVGAGMIWGPVSTNSAILPAALPPSTPAQESKQPIVMRWVPPALARQLESAPIEQPESVLPTQPESSSTTQLASPSTTQLTSAPATQPEPASVMQPQPLPTLGELAAEVQRLRDQISGVPPPSYSTF